MAEHSESRRPAAHRQLRFRRPDLDDLPEIVVPDGYALRCYRPGDAHAWAAVLNAAFHETSWTVEKIDREFLGQPRFLPERIFFAHAGGSIAGVAAAWQRNDPGTGYVHWVAVDPAHQGRRLGRLVTLATLHRFREEGLRDAILDTDDHRTAACATYLSLGFRPALDSPEAEAMWATVRAALGPRAG